MVYQKEMLKTFFSAEVDTYYIHNSHCRNSPQIQRNNFSHLSPACQLPRGNCFKKQIDSSAYNQEEHDFPQCLLRLPAQVTERDRSLKFIINRGLSILLTYTSSFLLLYQTKTLNEKD